MQIHYLGHQWLHIDRLVDQTALACRRLNRLERTSGRDSTDHYPLIENKRVGRLSALQSSGHNLTLAIVNFARELARLVLHSVYDIRHTFVVIGSILETSEKRFRIYGLSHGENFEHNIYVMQTTL